MSKRSRQAGIRFEREIASLFGGKRVPLSGGGAVKGDVLVQVTSDYLLLVECKYTSKKMVTISGDWFDQALLAREEMRSYGVTHVCLVVGQAYRPRYVFVPPDIATLRDRPLPAREGTIEILNRTRVFSTFEHVQAIQYRNMLWRCYPVHTFFLWLR